MGTTIMFDDYTKASKEYAKQVQWLLDAVHERRKEGGPDRNKLETLDRQQVFAYTSGMKIGKRPYQQRAVKQLRKHLKDSKKVLAVAPTAAGKTVIASLLVKASPEYKKVLWVAHRYELIDQAYKSLKDLGLDVGIFMDQEERLHGDARVNKKARVQVASVQTISSRGVPKGVILIVFDEAHRVASDSYQSIIESRPRAKVLGLTATPCRSDKKGLGDFFNVLYNFV